MHLTSSPPNWTTRRSSPSAPGPSSPATPPSAASCPASSGRGPTRRPLFDSGYGWVDGPTEYGGSGLGIDEADLFRHLEAEYDVPDQGCFVVGLSIVAP